MAVMLNQHINNIISEQITALEQHCLAPCDEQFLCNKEQSLGAGNRSPLVATITGASRRTARSESICPNSTRQLSFDLWT